MSKLFYQQCSALVENALMSQYVSRSNKLTSFTNKFPSLMQHKTSRRLAAAKRFDKDHIYGFWEMWQRSSGEDLRGTAIARIYERNI